MAIARSSPKAAAGRGTGSRFRHFDRGQVNVAAISQDSGPWSGAAPAMASTMNWRAVAFQFRLLGGS